MRKLTAELANTKVDRHHERLAHEGLDQMVADINSGYMPFWNNHDPRLPPLGRVAEARIEDDSLGELKVVGVIEIFEPGDEIPFSPTRKMFMRVTDPEHLTIAFDRTFRDSKSLALIRDIGQILNSEPTPEVKKAFDPLSVLTIAGAFIAGGISNGFLKELGADGYKALKEKLKLLLARRSAKKTPYVFRFSAIVGVTERSVEVDLLISDPSAAQLDRLFHTHLANADSFLLNYLPHHPEIQRVVFDAGGPELLHTFSVRSDAVPFFG